MSPTMWKQILINPHKAHWNIVSLILQEETNVHVLKALKVNGTKTFLAEVPPLNVLYTDVPQSRRFDSHYKFKSINMYKDF